jgi:glycosyltransferase involved in cell wall biosynthesis
LNLGIIGWLLKKINPQLHIVLIAHGYEVWTPANGKKGNIFKVVDEIWCVSEFTKTQVQVNYPWITTAQLKVFHNTIDAFFDIPTKFDKPYYLQHRYQLQTSAPLLITVTRLSSTEMYKGYDKVIELMKSLRIKYPNIKYLIAGKSDQQEYNRVKSLIKKYGVEEQVVLIGFVPDDELLDHYLLADLFVMPSKKEGFGIVFIEAMACGLPVVAGNKDGSPEALLNGEIGHLVNPDDINNIEDGIDEAINSLVSYQPKQLQQTILSVFGFQGFKNRLQEYLRVD